MDTINGIDFETWAAGCGHIAQGMAEDEVAKIIGVERPVWDDANEQWIAQLGVLAGEDMDVMTRYGEIFANPKIGKFADAGSEVPDLEDVLKTIPDLDTYRKVFWDQAYAAENGIDAVGVLQKYGLNLQTWGQANMHYMAISNELLSDQSHDNRAGYDEYMSIDNKWREHFEAEYKDKGVDLGSDIEF